MRVTSRRVLGQVLWLLGPYWHLFPTSSRSRVMWLIESYGFWALFLLFLLEKEAGGSCWRLYTAHFLSGLVRAERGIQPK